MTIEFEAIQPEGALANAGPLEVNQVTSDDNWLVLAWDRRKKGEVSEWVSRRMPNAAQ